MATILKDYFCWCLGIFAFSLLVACAPANLTHPDQLSYPTLEFQVPIVDQVTLTNGIKLYLKEDNELPLVQVSAMIGTGVLAAPSDKVGFDDLFAATWRTGGTLGRSPSELDERLDQLAADLAGSMGPYTTQMDLSVRSQDLPEGLEIMADILRRPAFAMERFELARLQAQELVRRQNDNPSAIAQRLLMAAIYPDHPIGFSPTISSLSMITRDDLVRFHTSYFAPNNLHLAISGDFDRQKLLAMLENVLGDWPVRDIPNVEIPPVVSSSKGRIRVVSKQVPQTTVLIGGLGLTKDNPDHYAAKVMNYILGGGGFNSRMMREIRSDRGLAYSAYSYFQIGRRLPGIFVAGTETKNESVIEVLELIRQIMNELRDSPVTPDELRLAKESQINSFVFGFDDSHAVVAQQMRLDFFGYPAGYLSTYRERISAVTERDVQRVAREFIRIAQQQIVLVGSPEKFSGELERFGLPVEEVPIENGL